MAVEEDEYLDSTLQSVTRNFVGARGVEAMSVTNSGGTTVSYPLYDIHGSMVATVSTTGTAWTIANERSYDVWGSVRSGATTGGPKGRYVANLGHVQDDESGLIYMRARYYEPSTGRFISEDRARDGFNWYAYCASNPVGFIDNDGNYSFVGKWFYTAGFLFALLGSCGAWLSAPNGSGFGTFLSVTCAFLSVTFFSIAISYENMSYKEMSLYMIKHAAVAGLVAGLVNLSWEALRPLERWSSAVVCGLVGAYIAEIGGALIGAIIGD